MIYFNARHISSLNTNSLPAKRLAGLLMILMLVSCVSDPAHKEALKKAKQGPVEEGVAQLKDASSNQPENQAYRVDYLRERERVVNVLLQDARRALISKDLNEAELTYQRVLSIDSENAQAKLGLIEVERSKKHAEAIDTSREALSKSDFKAADNALNPVLIEAPQDTEAQKLRDEIDAAKYTGAPLSQMPELGKAYKKPISLQFRDANLKMIFEAISKTSGLNIIFDTDVKNSLKATVFVKQATVEDTIALVLMQNQLEKKVLNENTLYIYPATPAKLKEHQDLVIRTFQLVNADAKQILVLLKTVLKAKDLFVNEKINSIVIRDTPDVVALASKLIAAQDVNDPEVMLEMEVLEVTSSLATELGLAYPNKVSVSLGDTIKTLRDWKGIDSKDWNVTNGLGVTLNLKKTDGEVNTLANPRIRVRQHEKAKIHIGERFPIITNTVTPSTGTPVVTGSIQYVDLGLKLEVEPDIHMDGEVGIKTALEVSSLGDVVKGGSGASETVAYRVNTRLANTVLRLKDGETQILAGLISNEDRKNATKVPGLGDIPLLGRLFSSHKNDKNKTELILAITPHIVRNIHQPDADLSAYWSGTDATVRSRPLTVEKMDAMKVESREGSVLPNSAPGQAVQTPRQLLRQPIAVPAANTDKPDVPPSDIANPAAIPPAPVPAPTGTVIKPAINSLAPPPVNIQAPATPAPPPAGVPLVVPRGAAPDARSGSMSDAEQPQLP